MNRIAKYIGVAIVAALVIVAVLRACAPEVGSNIFPVG